MKRERGEYKREWKLQKRWIPSLGVSAWRSWEIVLHFWSGSHSHRAAKGTPTLLPLAWLRLGGPPAVPCHPARTAREDICKDTARPQNSGAVWDLTSTVNHLKGSFSSTTHFTSMACEAVNHFVSIIPIQQIARCSSLHNTLRGAAEHVL